MNERSNEILMHTFSLPNTIETRIESKCSKGLLMRDQMHSTLMFEIFLDDK